jgi:hypothetical protein
VARERLREIDAERLVYESIKRACGSGSLILTPLEPIERLAALIATSRQHRHRYYGVLAPNAPVRSAVTAPAGCGTSGSGHSLVRSAMAVVGRSPTRKRSGGSRPIVLKNSKTR